jgi:hypothetical protein
MIESKPAGTRRSAYHRPEAVRASPGCSTRAAHIAARASSTAARKSTAAMATLEGMKFESPRGPIQIDPQTRDIIENIYIRRSQP